MPDDFISQYLAYTQDTEAPAIYHRWSILAAMSAYMGRTYYVKHGHFNIYPNLYVILLGGAGTRKNTAINLAKKTLRSAGYRTIAPTKTTKEKFFIDLSEQGSPGSEGVVEDILEQNLFGGGSGSNGIDHNSSICHEIFIASGEFNTFFGNNILDFLTDLGEMWDFEGAFESKIKNGKSIVVYNPTISILGGNTPTLFSSTFPPEIIGQGFFSRTLLIYGERTREKITFPQEPAPEATAAIVESLQRFRAFSQTQVSCSKSAQALINKIYHAPDSLTDPRFESFYNRRLTILFKLCTIVAVSYGRNVIGESDVLYANTMLSHAEHLMPKALGEFGRAKNSDVSHKVIQIIYGSDGIVSLKEIWKQVHTDLEKYSDLAPILQNLVQADKIQPAPEGRGFLPKRVVLNHDTSDLVDYNLLTAEERKMSK